MDLHEMLREVDDLEATDLYLISGAVPAIALHDRLLPARSGDGQRLSAPMAESFARRMTTPEQWEDLRRRRELNIAYTARGLSRFRVSLFWQRGAIGMVIRRVVEAIPTMRRLGLPPILREVALAERGLALVTGATGTGKSTTLAAMIDYRNHLLTGHIVTVEDPIEFLFHHRRSIVTQREIGLDTTTFENALRNSMRQSPDVIMIGELRDAETVRFALQAAETGHLVLSTLHSTNAVLTIKRLLNFFPSDMHDRILGLVSQNLVAIVSQRLAQGRIGGRVAAVEILLNNPRVQDLIFRGEFDKLRAHLDSEHHEGSASFDLALYRLVRRNEVAEEEALLHANSANDLSLKLKGVGIEPASAWEDLRDSWQGIGDDYTLPDSPRLQIRRPDPKELYTNEGAPLSASPPPPGSRPAAGSRSVIGVASAQMAALQPSPLAPRDSGSRIGPRPSIPPAGAKSGVVPRPPHAAGDTAARTPSGSAIPLPEQAGQPAASAQRQSSAATPTGQTVRASSARVPTQSGGDPGMPPRASTVRASGTAVPKPDLDLSEDLDELD